MTLQRNSSKNDALNEWALATRSGVQRYQNLAQNVPLVVSNYTMMVRLKGGASLVFNSVTRALSRLNENETRVFSSWKDKRIIDQADDPALSKLMLSNGFLVPVDSRELEQIRNEYFSVRRDKRQMSLTVAPTMACNLACGYCFQGLDKDLDHLDNNVPDAIYDFVKSQKETLGGLTITWYGGEPLMAKKTIFDLADRLISFCDRQGIQYGSSIVTNGYFLTPKIAQQLWTRRCTSAQVTVDGIEETHDKMRPMTSGRGSFATIMKNIGDVLEETPLGISLRVNVGLRNVHECDQLLDEFERREFGKKGNFTVYFAPIDAATEESGTAKDEGMKRHEYNKAVNDLGKRARSMGLAGPLDIPQGIQGMCVAAQDNGYVITHKGDIHKCWETAHDPRKRVGTIFEPEAMKLTLNSALWQAWSPFESDVCTSCKILPMCGGFCAHRFLYQGAGDENALPCPEWKWNTAEYLFARAVELGAASEDEWLEAESTATAMQSGRRHSPASLKRTQDNVLTKIRKGRGIDVDQDYLINGDGRFFEIDSHAAVAE